MKIAAEHCPLCGGPNDCQLCSVGTYKGPCWCEKPSIPDPLLARVPPELRNQACICPACVAAFHRENSSARPPALRPGDFYFDRGLMVFSGAYHLRRGYCCDNDCRHCPYPVST